VRHPAKYCDDFIPLFARLLGGTPAVLDPMAGTGKLARIKGFGYQGEVLCNDILDWEDAKDPAVDRWTFCDAARLPYQDGSVPAVCTSPTYGNKMGEHRAAVPGQRIFTYRAGAGRELDPENTGRMEWGRKYRDKHLDIYRELVRVLAPGGIMVVNVSDFIRRGRVVEVAEWHRQALLCLGLNCCEDLRVPTRRMRLGANWSVRVDHERIMAFRKPAAAEEAAA